MIQWSKETKGVLFEEGSITYLGKIVRFPNDTQDLGHFMFKTSFGVHATMLLIGYDEVVVGGLPGMPPHISLRNLQPNESQIILSTIEETRPSQADIQKVLDQFRSWINWQIVMQIHL